MIDHRAICTLILIMLLSFSCWILIVLVCTWLTIYRKFPWNFHWKRPGYSYTQLLILCICIRLQTNDGSLKHLETNITMQQNHSCLNSHLAPPTVMAFGVSVCILAIYNLLKIYNYRMQNYRIYRNRESPFSLPSQCCKYKQSDTI